MEERTAYRQDSVVIGPLLEAERKGRLGYTLLLAGRGGYGAYQVAIRLAQALLCPAIARRPVAWSSESHHGEACGVCRNVARLNHPDFLVIAPLSPEYRRLASEGKAPMPDPVTKALTDDIFVSLGVGANWSVTTDQARGLIRWAAMTPWEARGKVALLAEADRLREDSADILLKTLEEPPANVTFILVSDRPQDLLPTVRSRCHQVRIRPLAEGEIARLLVERGATEEDSLAVAPLANGDLWQARALLGGETNRLRRGAAELIGTALDPNRTTAEVMAEVRTMLDGASASGPSELVRWIISWLREVLLAVVEVRRSGDEMGAILPAAQKMGRERLTAWIEEADKAYEMLGRNVTPHAVVTALLTFPRDERKMRAAMTFPPLGQATPR